MTAPFCVHEPFTANDYADLIVRSSDGHNFHVVKGFLAFVSTIFKDMLSLPQAHAVQEPDALHVLPVVDVSESGSVVDALLRYIYPGEEPQITSIDIAFDILLAAQKYEMDRISCDVEDTICNLRSINDECVLRSFALACTHRLSKEAEASAAASLRINLTDVAFLNSLNDVPGKAVVRLFRYHAEVRQKLVELFSSGTGFPEKKFGSVIYCKACGYFTNKRAEWSIDMFSKVERDVYTKGPMSKDIFSQEILRNAVSNACSKCMPHILRFGTEKLYDSMVDTIKSVVSEVKFEIPWVEEPVMSYWRE